MEGIQVTGETRELLEIHFTMADLAYYTANRLTRGHGSMLVRKFYYGDAADYWATWQFHDNLPLRYGVSVEGQMVSLVTTTWVPWVLEAPGPETPAS